MASSSSSAQGADKAWTGEGETVEDFEPGDIAFMLNPYFKDGTRLRLRPEREAPFGDDHILNDAEVEVLDVHESGFILVRAEDNLVEGWVRGRNLTHKGRGKGLVKEARRNNMHRSQTISNLAKESPRDDEAIRGINGDKQDQSMKKLMVVGKADGKIDDEVAEQTAAIRRQLKKKRKGTLDPQSKFMARWDMTTSLAMIFTAKVTPFEVCILEPISLAEMLHDPLSWVNRVVDCIFAVDVLIQCITAYQEPADRGGGWVYDQKQIFCRYAKSWMGLDVMTTVPIDLVIAVYEEGRSVDGGRTDDEANAGTRALRIIRMLRLLKLARILRGSRVIARWQSQFGISYAVVTLWQFLFLTCFTAHWMACFWVLIGRGVYGRPVDHATAARLPRRHAEPCSFTLAFTVNTYEADYPVSDWSHAFTTSWIHKAGLADAAPAEIYGVSIYCAFSIIFGCGPGPALPASVLEYYVQVPRRASPRLAVPRRASPCLTSRDPPPSPSLPLPLRTASRFASPCLLSCVASPTLPYSLHHVRTRGPWPCRWSSWSSGPSSGRTSSPLAVVSSPPSTRTASTTATSWMSSTTSPRTRSCRGQ